MTKVTRTFSAAELVKAVGEARRGGNFDEALALLEANTSILPPERFRRQKAMTLIQMKRFEAALAEVDQIRPEMSLIQDLGLTLECLVQLGRLEAAKDMLLDSRDVQGEEMVALFSKLAEILAQKGDYQGGVLMFERARHHNAPDQQNLGREIYARAVLLDRDGLQALGTEGFEGFGTLLFNAIRTILDRIPGFKDSPVSLPDVGQLAVLTKHLLDHFDVASQVRHLEYRFKIYTDHETEHAFWERYKALCLRDTPASLSELLEIQDGSEVLRPNLLANLATWLGKTDDWKKDVAVQGANRKKIEDILLFSSKLRQELCATSQGADWSDVMACQAAGKPVFLVSMHYVVIPYLMEELIRSGLPFLVIASDLNFGRVDAFKEYFVPHKGLETNATLLMRAMIRQLKAGGVAFAAVDLPSGARPYEIEEHRVRANLSREHWSTAKKYGAEVFHLDTSWHEEGLAARITHWPMPETQDPEERQRFWNTRVVGSIREAYLRDVRNVHGFSWFKGPLD